ncbi:transposable element Tc1 transposase [Trichonephila clavipes]|nr:transposable element Tc1 transposase [Trichonephila clavipes]
MCFLILNFQRLRHVDLIRIPFQNVSQNFCSVEHGIFNSRQTDQPLDDGRNMELEAGSTIAFERGRIVGLREAGLSYRAVAAHVQRNNSTIMRVSKQWTDEGLTARKSGSGPRNVTSAREDRRLVRMDQTDSFF